MTHHRNGDVKITGNPGWLIHPPLRWKRWWFLKLVHSQLDSINWSLDTSVKTTKLPRGCSQLNFSNNWYQIITLLQHKQHLHETYLHCCQERKINQILWWQMVAITIAYKVFKPKDRDLIIFLIKDHNTTQSHESRQSTEQIKNMNNVLMSFID